MKQIKTVGRNSGRPNDPVNDVDIGNYLWRNYASRDQLRIFDQGQVDEEGRPCYFIENRGKNEVVIVSEDGKSYKCLAPYGQDYYGKVWHYHSFEIHMIAGVPATCTGEKCLIQI